MEGIYMHGAYGELGETVQKETSAVQSGVLYIGTAPVGQVHDYAGAVETVLRLNNFNDAKRKIGYSNDWESFTLCEAVDAHFRNSLQPVGPIYVVNVLDPETMRGQEQSATITMKKGRGLIPGDKVIENTITIANGESSFVNGSDFTVDYNETLNGMVVTDLGGVLGQQIDVTYYEVDADPIDAADIIGTVGDTGKTGLQLITSMFNEYGVAPGLLLAPKWSMEPMVHDAMIAASQKIDGKFYCFALNDLPLNNGGSSISTILQAIAYKEQSVFGMESEKTAWPRGGKGSAKVYHISTLTAVACQQVDASHDGVPMESPSNTRVDIDRYVITGVERPQLYDETEVNELNAKGITTLKKQAGQWYLWGPHTASYDFENPGDIRSIFDVSMRMLYYLINSFVIRNSSIVGKPLTIDQVDTILNAEQIMLDGLVSMGALIGSPRIKFAQVPENTVQDIVNGEFVFESLVTPAPVLKALTLKLSYTDEGIYEFVTAITEEEAA